MKDTSMIASTITSETPNSNSKIDALNENQQPTEALKWSTKEKLYLISFVLLNGDSNWTYINDQLNKWMISTTTEEKDHANIAQRASTQCSKQYNLMVRNYTKKNGFCDLKKIYNELVEERLKELKATIVNSQQQYNDLRKEIEQIYLMNGGDFDELTKIWISLKTGAKFGEKQQETTVKDIQTTLNIEALNNEELNLSKNIQKILYLNEKKKREEAEAQEAARLAAIQLQEQLEKERKEKEELELKKRLQEEQEMKEKAEREAAEALAAAMEAAKKELEELEKKKKQLEKEEEEEIKRKAKEIQEIENERQHKRETNELNLKKEDIKDEQDVEMVEQKGEATEIDKKDSSEDQTLSNKESTGCDEEVLKSAVVINNDDDEEESTEKSNNSDEDLPLGLIKQKQQQQQKKQKQDQDDGIEWKPDINQFAQSPTSKATTVIQVESSSSSKPATEASKTETLNSSSSRRKSAKGKGLKLADVITSLSSQKACPPSSPPLEKTNNQAIKSDTESNTKKETRSTKSTPMTSKNQPQAHSDDASELIFAPTIKEDKNNKPLLSAAENEATVATSISKKSNGKKSINSGTSSNGNKRKTIDSAEEIAAALNEQSTGENENRSLRSRSNQHTQKATSVSNKRKSTTTSNNAISNKSTPKQPEETIQSKSSTHVDSGLVSIIKSEPVQISASSIIATSSSSISNESDDTIITKVDESVSSIKKQQQQDSNVLSTSSNSSCSVKNTLFEDEKAYKAWKKSIMMVLNNITSHKHASIFMLPVKEEIAPGYTSIIKRPMDLGTIKKAIENGTIKTTREFQRDVMLMFTNAIMYNSSSHDIHKISLEMYKEVIVDIEQLLNAQETMGEYSKLLRNKETRSSTASDRGLLENEKGDSNIEAANEMVVNLLMKHIKLPIKDDALETSSIKSNSSISTPLTSNSNSNSNTNNNKSSQNKLETSSVKSNSTTAAAATTTSNSRKRRPSVSTEQQSNTSINTSLTSQQPKSKRRKSNR